MNMTCVAVEVGKSETYTILLRSTLSLAASVSMALCSYPCGSCQGVCGFAGAVGWQERPWVPLSASLPSLLHWLGRYLSSSRMSGFQILPSPTFPRHKLQVISLNAPPAGDVGS